MADQLLSTDPKAGLLSQDPSAGLPKGSAATRKDANILGIDHDKLKTMVEGWVSKLDPTFQQPAAVKAADFLASLAEMFSSPETVATMGAKPAMAAMDTIGDAVKGMTGKVTGARVPLGSVVETAGRFIQSPKKVVGEAVERAGTALKGTGATPATPAATMPPGAPAAVPGPVPVAPTQSPARMMNELALAARRAGTKLTEAQEAQAVELVKGGKSAAEAVNTIIPPTRSQAMGTLLKMAAKPPADMSKEAIKLTASEFKAGLDMLAQGKSAKEAMGAIMADRARAGASAFSALPTDAEMTAEMTRRAVAGQKSLMPKYGPK